MKRGKFKPTKGMRIFFVVWLGWLGGTNIMFRQIWRADYYQLLAQGEQDNVDVLVVDNIQYKDLLCV